MPFKCLVDGTEHSSREKLHFHLKKLKITQEDYYTKYLNRKDKLTGEPIKFKSVEQYVSADFNHKNNLKKWLKEYPEEGKVWAINWLKKRMKEKNLVRPPTQVELLSLMCPTMHYYERIGGYFEICKSLGMQPQFELKELVFQKLPQNVTLIQDTREQSPLIIKGHHIQIQKLNVGDYALAEPNDKKIYIERKSLNDLVGTMSRGYGRFTRELERAKSMGAYIVVLVEDTIQHALSFNHLPHMKYVKTNPAHIFKNIRELFYKFDNFQLLFVGGRVEAAKILIRLFELGDQVKTTDLQFSYDTKALKAI